MDMDAFLYVENVGILQIAGLHLQMAKILTASGGHDASDGEFIMITVLALQFIGILEARKASVVLFPLIHGCALQIVL